MTSFNVGWGGLTICVFNHSNSICASLSVGDPKDSLQVFPNEFAYSNKLKNDFFNWDTTALMKISQATDRGSLPGIDVSRVIIKDKRINVQTLRNLYEYDLGYQQRLN